MKPYSKDLRLRVLAAVDAGSPREEVAKTFSVSIPTIKRWLKRRRETGDVEPEPIPGRPARTGAMLKEWLPEHLEANDDLTMEEHREDFEEHFGEEVSTSTIGRAIAALPDGGWPLKKVPDSSRARRGGEGFVAVAGFPFRRKEAGVRGRVRLLHLHDAPEGEGSEGEEGLWEGPEEPGQEHHADRRDHPPRGDGRADDRGGRHRLGGLRGLRGALPGPHPTGRTGGGARRAGCAQAQENKGTHRSQRSGSGVLAVLLAGPEPHRGSLQ